ncbi:MAG: hypothetical protein M3P00_06845 [Gemmatimonadota bacterium]|nr:hypothetical protein [Gemmatimonadota bacterium]
MASGKAIIRIQDLIFMVGTLIEWVAFLRPVVRGGKELARIGDMQRLPRMTLRALIGD